jgi:hypothetical protein
VISRRDVSSSRALLQVHASGVMIREIRPVVGRPEGHPTTGTTSRDANHDALSVMV